MAFLKVFWKTTASQLNSSQQALCDAFFGTHIPMKNSEVYRGKLGRKTNDYKYELAQMFLNVVQHKNITRYDDILRCITSTLEQNFQDDVCRAFLSQIRATAQAWFDHPFLYQIHAAADDASTELPYRVYTGHRHACDAVLTAALASMFWFGLQLRSPGRVPTNDYFDILAYLGAHRRGADIEADIFSFDERVSVWVTGTAEFKRIGHVETILTDTTFLLPFPDAEQKIGPIIPDHSGWENVRALLRDEKDVIQAISQDVYSHLRCGTDGMRENTPIVGVMSIKSMFSGDLAQCQLYRTDYYTHRIMEKLKKRKGIHARTLPYVFSEDTSNAWRRTSLGINAIVVLEDSKKVVLVKRSKLAQYGNAGKIYPSVVETIDLVCRHNRKIPHDFDESVYSNAIVRATVRGLQEELGIPSNLYREEDIHICSAFHTVDFDQDNFFVVVILRHTDFDAVTGCIRNAPDFGIENSGIYCIDNDAQTILLHILNHQENMIDQTVYCLAEYVKRFL